MHLLLLLSALSCQLLSVQAQLCPAPFSLEAGKCVFVSAAQSHTWCEANRQCESVGGELLNSYDSIKQLVDQSIPSANCSCNLWVGVSDLADERNTSRAGWQRVNGRGLLQEDSALFRTGEPSGGNPEQCLRTGSNKIFDSGCKARLGFVCEFLNQTVPNPPAGIWKAADFKRNIYHSSNEYCFTDVPDVSSAVRCTAAAMRAGSSRHVLYNSKLRACRLLLFTDAQVEEEIETSADWVKFSLV